MFVGRDKELVALEQHYATGRFEMAVIYGRRRVGKTALISEFVKGKPCLFFTAQEKSNEINLRGFSEKAFEFFSMGGSLPSFGTWESALSFVAERAREYSLPFVFVFDEFPYAAKAHPALPSAFQIAVDHEFSGIDMTMILCGSNQGFMESEVLGSKSPLYGRRTMQIRLRPLDFFAALPLLGGSSAEDKVRFYAAFGGTPYYLEQIDRDANFAENVSRLFFNPYGLLFREPEMLLRQELRETALYSSILDAVAAGATQPKLIAERAGVEQNSIGKYLTTLSGMGLIRRDVPFGENPDRSRSGIWHIDDPFFAYWYRFVSPYIDAIDQGAGNAIAGRAARPEMLETYVGGQFENICMQWVYRKNAMGDLGFLAAIFGKWWGGDPTLREQVDIDVVASDSQGHDLLAGECNWRNSFDETDAIETLEHRAGIIAKSARRHYVLFTKRPVSDGTRKKAADRGDLQIVTADDLTEP